MGLSIRWKLIFSIGLPLLLVYLAVLWIAYAELKEEAYQRVQARISELALRYAAEFDGDFSTVAQVAESTAAFLTDRPDISEEKLFDLLKSNVNQEPLIYGSAIAFEEYAFSSERRLFAPYVWRKGRGVSRMDVAKEAYDYTTWDWFTRPKVSEGAVWTNPFFDEGAGDIIMCTRTAPFYNRGKFRGVATIDVKLENLQQQINQEELEGGSFVILSREGVFISHPNPEFIMTQSVITYAEEFKRPDIMKFGEEMLKGERGVGLVQNFPNQKTNFIAYARIPSTGWVFSVAVPEEQVMVPVWALLGRFSTTMLVGLGLIILILFLVSVRITRPLQRLAKTVKAFAKGDLSTRLLDTYERDEIGDLARTFNTMAMKLDQHVKALTEQTAAREAVESELRVARGIQLSLLPQAFPPYPQHKEFTLHATNASARQVAGDFFDFFFISEDTLALVIADVSGKGVPAAMFMAVARTLIRNYANDTHSPSEAFNAINNILVQDNRHGMFTTAIVLYYHIKTGRLRYANAGHLLPYVVDQKGKVKPFGEVTGTLLGAFEGQTFEESRGQLKSGEKLVLFTDGVPEARNPAGDFYGDEAFRRLLTRHYGESVRELCDTIMKEITDFQKNTPNDDATLLVLART